MTFGFKLSHRLARGFCIVGIAAALAACAGENPTLPPSDKPVNSVSVSPSSADLPLSASLQLSAILKDADGATLNGRAVTWTSDAEEIATVSASGLVESGADTGSATITASSEGKSAHATVRVKKNAPPPPPPPPPPPTEHAGYYVSPSGSSSGDGSRAKPWNFATALAGAGGKVQPGDTVWMLGGTYRGTFTSTVTGTSGKPVVFRQYPGERALIDGAGAARTATVLNVRGSWVVFWGFEMTNTDADRTHDATGNGGRPHALANYAPHTKYISLVVHDAGVGIYNDPNQYDVEITGCVFYNNGWQGPDRGHGHAIYLRSNTGPVTAHDNVLFNQFGYGVHVYTNPGDGLLNNITIEGNIAFNNGTLSTNSSSSNILVGGDDRADGDKVSKNMAYFPPGVTATNMKVGYGSLENGSVVLTDNYAVGGGPVLSMGYWSSSTISGNSFIGTSSVLSLSDPALSASRFAGQTGSSLPSSTKVFVRRVAYEKGRAIVAVYNWGNNGSVDVNLDGIMPLGAQYEIRNVQNWGGGAVTSGTFNGGSVSLPIQAVSPPTPVGWTTKRAPATGTTFGAYVVMMRE
ncbi:MAG TPA: Ig-like domain-containing protein [Gemmatimonadales bacterium]|nr:Ig-like domain-containing protein [Gemmatimonadales bacterium]